MANQNAHGGPDKAIKSVCVVGLGYIGLPTAATLASRGLTVIGVDTNPAIVEAINSGRSHFSEPDLEMLLQAATTVGQLRATTTPEAADVFIIAVPTPFNDDRSPDLSYVDAATDAIAPVIDNGNVVILESTSPVGTTRRIAERLAAARPDLRFPGTAAAGSSHVHIAHCPERVLPGQMVRELIENDRIIGGMTEACADKAAAVYSVFLRGESHLTTAETAELVKLTENAYRDVNIAFANELSMVCNHLDLNVWDVISLANRHPRVAILQPGTGVGGHCIAVDPWFIVASAPDQTRLMQAAREVNDSKPGLVAAQVKERAARFRNPVVACLGLTFKPDVDDTRQSPAIDVVRELAKADIGRIIVADPNLHELPRELRNSTGLEFAETMAAVRQADIVVILVAHTVFAKLLREELLNHIVIDPTGLSHRAFGQR